MKRSTYRLKKTYENIQYIKRIIHILESLSLDDSIKLDDLTAKCELIESQKAKGSKLRRLINIIIEDYCIPIVSGNDGYKIARTQEDLNKFRKRMYKQMEGIKIRIDNATHAYNVFDEGKIKSYSELIDKKPKRLELKINNGKSNSSHSFVN